MSFEDGISDEAIEQAATLEEDIIEFEVPYITTDDDPSTFVAQIPESMASADEAMLRAEERAHKFKELAGTPERRPEPISLEDVLA